MVRYILARNSAEAIKLFNSLEGNGNKTPAFAKAIPPGYKLFKVAITRQDIPCFKPARKGRLPKC